MMEPSVCIYIIAVGEERWTKVRGGCRGGVGGEIRKQTMEKQEKREKTKIK